MDNRIIRCGGVVFYPVNQLQWLVIPGSDTIIGFVVWEQTTISPASKNIERQ